MRKHTEIARKYCHILRKYGPHSSEVKHATLAMSTEMVDSEVLRRLDAIILPPDVRD